MTDGEADIGLWETVQAKADYAGKIFSFGEALAVVSVDGEDYVSETKRFRVKATGATIAAESTSTLKLAKTADLKAADVSTFAAMQKVSPAALDPEQASCGDWKVEFYVALSKWAPVIKNDLIKITPNKTRVEEKDGVYTSTDGHYIGYVTMWLKTIGDGPTSGRGGGGCDSGLGVWALAALPWFLGKKSRRE